MRVAVVLGSSQGPIALVDDALGRRLRSQLNAKGVAWLSAAAHHGDGAGLARAVADECVKTKAVRRRGRTLLVSVPWRDDALTVLADLARFAVGSTMSVRLLVERQDRMAEHLIVDGIRAGKPVDEDDLTDTIDHSQSVRAVAALPNVSSVTAQPYELAHRGATGLIAWLDDLLADVGLRGRLDLRPLLHGSEPLRAFHSYSPRGLHVGRTLLPEMTTSGQCELLHEFLTASFPATEDRLLPETTRVAIVTRHRRVNHEFFASFVPDLPPDSYGHDAATHLVVDKLEPAHVPRPSPLLAVRRRAGKVRRAVKRRVARRDKLPTRRS